MKYTEFSRRLSGEWTRRLAFGLFDAVAFTVPVLLLIAAMLIASGLVVW